MQRQYKQTTTVSLVLEFEHITHVPIYVGCMFVYMCASDYWVRHINATPKYLFASHRNHLSTIGSCKIEEAIAQLNKLR